MKALAMIATAVFAMSCADRTQPKVQSAAQYRTSEFEKNVILGDLLATRGRFLEAGFFYEAALFFADDEIKILPKLIAAQVKSDRLRAARVNVKRLIALAGRRASLERLAALLDTYAPSAGNSPVFEEVAP
jgi:DNA-binding SARP family transcriptional activator